MSDLHDMAKDLGVETVERKLILGANEDWYERDELRIAHECALLLNADWEWSNAFRIWFGYSCGTGARRCVFAKTFPECVIELWKRQKAST